MSLSGKSVLIVDDDMDVRNLIRKILENAGMEISETDTIPGALDAIQKKFPSLVILDIELQGETGFHFLLARKKNEILQSIPILVISAHNDPATVKKAIALGANNFLIKPFTAALLLQKTRRVLHDLAGSGSYHHLQSPARVEASFSGSINKMNSLMMQIECPIRIGTGKAVSVHSPFLEQLGIPNPVCRAWKSPATKSLQGQYQSLLQLVGLTEAEHNEISKVLLSWSQLKQSIKSS